MLLARCVDVVYEVLLFCCSRFGNTVKQVGPTITLRRTLLEILRRFRHHRYYTILHPVLKRCSLRQASSLFMDLPRLIEIRR